MKKIHVNQKIAAVSGRGPGNYSMDNAENNDVPNSQKAVNDTTHI
jgi:hypothetical protein